MNERQKKIMVPYEETTDTCPDCSNHPCDCGMPAGYTPTPMTDERKASFALDTIRQLEAELSAVTEQLKAAQDGWHDEITKGLSELRRAESIYTKAQERAERSRPVTCSALLES